MQRPSSRLAHKVPNVVNDGGRKGEKGGTHFTSNIGSNAGVWHSREVHAHGVKFTPIVFVGSHENLERRDDTPSHDTLSLPVVIWKETTGAILRA